jgi:hypothetical protein
MGGSHSCVGQKPILPPHPTFCLHNLLAFFGSSPDSAFVFTFLEDTSDHMKILGSKYNDLVLKKDDPLSNEPCAELATKFNAR